MNRLNAFRWFVFGFLMGIWAIWLSLVLIFQDDSSAQAKLNPLLWGCLIGQFIIIIPLSLLSSKARKYQQNQKEALEAASLVSS